MIISTSCEVWGVETNGYNEGLMRPYFWGGYVRGVG